MSSGTPSEERPSRIPVPGENRRTAVLAVGTVTDDLFSRDELEDCIENCGGQLLSLESGIATAVFGTGVNTEQVCRRAVACAFRILRTAAARQKNTSSQCRIGITGEESTVYLYNSGFKNGTESVIQKTISVMGEASPGTILASSSVMAPCRDFWNWKRFSRRGWVPEEADSGSPVSPLLQGVPLLGRKREMDHLASALRSYRKWHTHQPVFITGEPGTGKTMLLDEFLRKHSSGNTRVAMLVNRLWDQPPLGMWDTLMDGGSFDPYVAIMDRVRELTASGELIIRIEDLHWTDEPSLKLLEQLFQSLCDSGAFLILSSRNPPPGFMQNKVEKLTVTGLEPGWITRLAENILGRASGMEAKRLTKLLMKKTGGNPLLSIELIRLFMENGSLGRNRKGEWFLLERLEETIPAGFESFLQARMAVLKPFERFGLQVAAALGNGFRADDFLDVHRSLGGEGGEIILSRLVNTGFLVESANRKYSFSNSLLSSAVDKTIIPENRILIHRRAAEVLSRRTRSSDDVRDIITLARHWLESDSRNKAIPWLMKALTHCIDLGDLARAETISREIHRRAEGSRTGLDYQDARLLVAMGRFQPAEDLLCGLVDSLQGKRKAHALFLRGQAAENLGLSLKEAVELYEASALMAERAGDMNIKAQALSSAGSLHLALGNRRRSIECFNEALEHRKNLETPSLARLHGNMGILMHRTGSHDEAIRHYSRTLELGRKCGHLSIEANALSFMGQVEINMGRREQGLARYRKALAIHRRAGNRRGECATLGNLGGQLARFGDCEEAMEMLEQAISIAEEIGHNRGLMTFYSNMGLACKLAGDYSRAETCIRKAMEMITRSGDRRAMAVVHLNLCTVLSRMNRLSEAVEEARRALRSACAVDALTTQARALGNLGWLMIQTDRLKLAVNFFDEAYKRFYLAGDHSMLADTRTGKGRAFLDLGLIEEADQCRREAEYLDKKYGMDYEAKTGLNDLSSMIRETGYGQNS